MLSRIDSAEDRRLTRDILSILSFSFRPLSLWEICEVLQIVPGVYQLDESKRLTNPRDVLSICGSLLSYREDTDTVALAHHSVKTYLISDLPEEVSYFKLSELEGHRSLATNCLSYLLLDSFSSGPRWSLSVLDNHYRRFPFLRYASISWAFHAQKLEELGEFGECIWDILKKFLFSADHGRGNFLAWVELLIPMSENIEITSPLYYAASFGLATVVRYLLQAGADIEERGGRCRATPINIASYRGHTETVKVLLEHGADPRTPDDEGSNAIEWAKYNGHYDICQLFLEEEDMSFD